MSIPDRITMFADNVAKLIDQAVAWLKLLPARAKVIADSAVTRLLALAAAITTTVQLVAPQLPDAWAVDVGRWSATALAVIGALVEIIRRVTPVLTDQRGLLGPEVSVHEKPF